MEATSKTKTISTDFCALVRIRQYFKVPLDYEIYGDTPREAYDKLIEEFGYPKVNAGIKVPMDYEIYGDTPREVFDNLIEDFGNPNVNSVNEPEELDKLALLSIDFNVINCEVIQQDHKTK